MSLPTKPEPAPADERDFAAYVYAVGAAIGVPKEAINYDFSDTISAYLALGRHCPRHPDRDLMLLWSTHEGWSIALEAPPGEPQLVLARYTDELMPQPRTLARFVAEQINRPR